MRKNWTVVFEDQIQEKFNEGYGVGFDPTYDKGILISVTPFIVEVKKTNVVTLLNQPCISSESGTTFPISSFKREVLPLKIVAHDMRPRLFSTIEEAQYHYSEVMGEWHCPKIHETFKSIVVFKH
jgi:hypothetical protein